MGMITVLCWVILLIPCISCRDELYKECVTALQGGLLLTSKNFNAIKAGIAKAFETVDTKLLIW